RLRRGSAARRLTGCSDIESRASLTRRGHLGLYWRVVSYPRPSPDDPSGSGLPRVPSLACGGWIMKKRSGFIVVSGAILGSVGALAGCIQPFTAGSGGASAAGGSSGQGGMGGAGTSSSSSGTLAAGACDVAHPDACGSGSFCLVPTCAGAGTCIKFQAD